MSKKWLIHPVENEDVDLLKKELELNPILCQLLVQRGITDPNDAKSFLAPTFEDLIDPDQLSGLTSAVAQIQSAVDNEKLLYIACSPDLDGILSLIIFKRFFADSKVKIKQFIPHIFGPDFDFYGQALANAPEEDHLMIGFGFSPIGEETAANQIVCFNNASIEIKNQENVTFINPGDVKNKYASPELSVVGVAYKMLAAYAKNNEISEEKHQALLPYVSMGILDSNAKITGENRILVHFGNKILGENPDELLAHLVKTTRLESPVSCKSLRVKLIQFLNMPLLYSDCALLDELFMTTKVNKMEATTEKMVAYRTQFFEEMRETMPEAMRMYDRGSSITRFGLIIYNPKWAPYLAPRIANNLMEKLNRVVMVVTNNQDGKVYGYGKSYSGYDLVKHFENLDLIPNSFFGKEDQVSFSFSKQHLDPFREQFTELIQDHFNKEENQLAELCVNAPIDLKELTLDFFHSLSQFAPFGPGNISPIFQTDNVKDTGNSRLLGGDHLSMVVKQGRAPEQFGIGFGLGKFLPKIQKSKFDICYTIEEQKVNGKQSLRLNVKGIKIRTK